MQVNACANSQMHKAATVFQRKAVGVTNEAFSGRVNSKENQVENQVVAGCIYKCMHCIFLNDKMKRVT